MKRIWTKQALWPGLGLGLGLALAAVSVGVTPAAAQELGAGDRITIVVPDLAPDEEASRRFGRNVAEELQDLINELHTHQAVTRRNLTRVRRAADLSHEDLFDCVKLRQLAMWVNRQQQAGQEIRGANSGQLWGLVLCAEYEDMGNRQMQVNARFVGTEDGEEFRVPEFTANEREPDEAAQQILQTFDRWQTQLRHTVFCQQYMESGAWDRALENCNRALEINSTSLAALYNKALILREMDRPEESLAVLDEMLEIDPMHENALKTGGIVAAEANLRDQAREYLDRYMELNPGDVAIRLTIARDIFNAGDPVVALEFAREGLEITPDDLTLITYIGHFAAEAARRAEAAMNGQQGSSPAMATEDPARVTEYYQIAADSYRRAYEEQGIDSDTQTLQRLIISLFKLGQYEEAVELGRTVVSQVDELPETAPASGDNDVRVMTGQEKARIWDAYSRALQEAGELEEALAAIERTRDLGGPSPSLTQRQAVLQLQLGQEDEAVAALVESVEGGEMAPEQAFNIVFANAYQQKFQRGQLEPAYRLLDLAGPLAQVEKDRLARNFWRGYIRFEQAKVAHEPMTAASAAEAKPLFEEALDLFEEARGYEQYHPSANVPDLIENAQKWILVEEGLIKRGR